MGDVNNARGKRRADTVQSFATNVELESVLAGNHTPLMPFRAVSDAEAAVAASKRIAATAPDRVPPTSHGARPASSSRLPWIVAGAAALLAIAATVIAFRPGGAQPGSADAGRPAAIVDAAPGRRGVVLDAGTNLDAAAVPSAVDAGGAPDARRPKRRLDAGAARPAGTGTLTVGASPRGDVYLDGRSLGEAPGQWKVPAGQHSVEVRYKDQSRTFRVNVAPDETRSVPFTEFTP